MENPAHSPKQVTLELSTSPPELITPLQQATTQNSFGYTTPSLQQETQYQGLQGMGDFMEKLRAKNGADKGKQPVRQNTTESSQNWLDERAQEAEQYQEIYKECQQEIKHLQDLDQLRQQNLERKEALERAEQGQQLKIQQQQELEKLKANKAAQLAEMQELLQEQEKLQRKLDAIRDEHQEEPTHNQALPTRLAAGGNPDDDPNDSDDSDDKGNPGNRPHRNMDGGPEDEGPNSHYQPASYHHYRPDYDHIQVPPPGRFDPSRTSVFDWLFSVQSYFNLKDIKENKKVAFAAMYLEGIALTWWKSLYLRSTQPTTWKEFQQEISTKFRRIDEEMVARNKLRNIKQGFSVENYIAEFTNLSLRISDLSEPEACDRFKQGLKPHIQAQLLRQNIPNDLPLIQQVAHREDILAFNMAKLTRPQESHQHNPARRHHFKKPEE
jgi:Retrotransposon gag protein